MTTGNLMETPNAGHPGVPYGDRQPGEPHVPSGHEGHDLAHLTSRRGEMAIGRVVCLDCETVVGPLVLCNEPTKGGRPCRVPVRVDLGFDRCWSHDEGAGRTNQPRRNVTR
jgi:hypothetical protein